MKNQPGNTTRRGWQTYQNPNVNSHLSTQDYPELNGPANIIPESVNNAAQAVHFHTPLSESNAQNTTISEPYACSDIIALQHTSLATGKKSEAESVNAEKITNQRLGITPAQATSPIKPQTVVESPAHPPAIHDIQQPTDGKAHSSTTERSIFEISESSSPEQEKQSLNTAPDLQFHTTDLYDPEVESSRTSLASRTHFEVLGLEASSPWPWPRSLRSSKIALSSARGQHYF